MKNYTEKDKAENDWKWIKRMEQQNLLDKDGREAYQKLEEKYGIGKTISRVGRHYYIKRNITASYIGKLLKRHKYGTVKKPEEVQRTEKISPKYILHTKEGRIENDSKKTIIEFIRDALRHRKAYDIIVEERKEG